MEQLRPSSRTENINGPDWQAMLRSYFNPLSPYKSPVKGYLPFTNEQRRGVTVPGHTAPPLPPAGPGGRAKVLCLLGTPPTRAPWLTGGEGGVWISAARQKEQWEQSQQ